MGNIIPKFDEAGNIIIKKPKLDKLEEELEEIKNVKKVINSKYEGCNKEWETDLSRIRHEMWCPKNPNARTYYKKPKTEAKKPKKNEVKPKTKTPKEKDIIKELKEFDKSFGLTDEQIVKYIRKKMGN